MSMIALTPRGAREQQTFRVLLNAMARPGSVDSVSVHDLGGEHGAALSIAEALIDHEVNFAVVPERAEIIDAVLRQTGSRVAAPEDADYVICEAESLARTLDLVKDGTLEFPDQSATVICRVTAIDGQGGERLRLSGPGIQTCVTVAIEGFSPEAQAVMAERNSHTPLGIDIVFVTASGRVVCINRNTRLEKESE